MHLDGPTPAYQIGSMVCRQAHFNMPWYRNWDERMGLSVGKVVGLPPVIFNHRKFWEWAAVAQALEERGMLVTCPP